jgi:uncharacterized membrane protein AbrB (regulator of aidB expression)
VINFIKNCPANLLIGSFLVIINFPVGWVGFAWFMHLAKKTSNMFFCYLGACFYALSWGLLFCGIFLCGKDYAKAVFYKYHTPIFIVTILTVASIIAFNLYFAKKRSKINEKTV